MTKTDKDKLKRLSPWNLGLIISSAVLIAAFVLVVLIPQHLRIQGIKRDRLKKSIKLEEQKRLYPVYGRTQQILGEQFTPQLPFPPRKAVSNDKVTGLSLEFDRIARESGLALVENHIGVDSFNQADLLRVDLNFEGRLLGVRECLIRLCGLAYFKKIDTISITTKKNDIRQCRVSLVIATEKSRPGNRKAL